MRLLLLILIFVDLNGYTQTKPLILKGKIDNCIDREMHISLKSITGAITTDTININKDGTFFYQTNRCQIPQKSSLRGSSFNIINILLAPGYNLNILADATDFKTLRANTKIYGKGGCVNQYRQKVIDLYLLGLDSLNYENSITSNPSVRIPELLKGFHLRDSILNVVFNHCDEPYSGTFEKMEYYNNMFSEYSGILEDCNDLPDSMAVSLANRFIPKEILTRPGDDKYLISDQYLHFISQFISFKTRLLVKQEKHKHENETDLALNFISKSFKGKVREEMFIKSYRYNIILSKSSNELILKKKQFSKYISLYVNKHESASLEREYSTKYKFLNSLKIGSKAPYFTLSDDQDVKHSLSDFRGKVVYIDFWASWCHPCREETPFLRSVYEKYKNDDRLQIVSIAVGDAKNNWLKAVEHDKMDWLQLWDDKGNLMNDYNTNTIPKFVIIDKKGKLVAMDAPKPSDVNLLIQALEAAMKN